jgi:hypothetical protein
MFLALTVVEESLYLTGATKGDMASQGRSMLQGYFIDDALAVVDLILAYTKDL